MPKRRLCVATGCNKRSSFAPEGHKSIHCASHKKPGDVNVVNSTCISPSCRTLPSFGPVGGSPQRCRAHALPGDVNVKNVMCAIPGCHKKPSFAKKGFRAKHCAAHKEAGDVRVHGGCIHPGCHKVRAYSLANGKPLWCRSHAPVHAAYSLKRNECAHPGCKKRPSFSQPGCTPTNCGRHRVRGDINVSTKVCLKEWCGKVATFGPVTGAHKWCASHRMPGDVNLLSTRCGGEICKTYLIYERPYATKHNPVTGKHDLCTHCWRVEHPELDDKLSVLKEHFVLAEIQRQIPELEMYFLTHDCAIPGQSCSTKRPDMVWIVEDTLVHVEIDEGGKGHEDNLERLVGIHAASGLMYHACIRFNPDEYDDYPACLRRKQSRSGEPIYSKNAEEWDRRIPILIDHMESVLEACVNGQGSSVAGKTKLCF